MKKYLYCASLAGLTGVALGAFGAHALKDSLATSGMTTTWETAVLYQFVHALALLVVGLNADRFAPRAQQLFSRACFCWAAGVALFSGSLYVLALGGPRWLGPVTPVGGIFFIIGWLLLGLAAARSSRKTD